jgi:hypothetical protein
MSRDKAKLVSSETGYDDNSTKPSTAKGLAAAIRRSGLVGMWKNRDDVSDSGRFARKLRTQTSKRKVSKRAPARH